MAELHWFPAYAADWLGSPGISMMLPEQEGAYWRLLNLAWGKGDAEPSLPDDDAALAQMSRLGSRWKKLGGLVREQFTPVNGRLYNAKMSAVWQEQQIKHGTAVKRASAGGRAKADKLRASNSASSTPQALPVVSLGSASIEVDRELEDLSVNPPSGETELAAMLESDTDRTALAAVIVKARSRDACVIALHSMLTGNDTGVPQPTPKQLGHALRDFAANAETWNAALFRGYLGRVTAERTPRTSGSRPAKANPGAQQVANILGRQP